MNRNFKVGVRIFTILLIIIIGGGGSYYLFVTKPEPKKRDRPQPVVNVELLDIQKQNYQIILDSQGTVQPELESQLVAQVSGEIIYMHPQFHDGGFFKNNEILLKIDPRDYELALSDAKTGLADKVLSLVQAEQLSDEVAAKIQQAEAEIEISKQIIIEEEANVEQAKLEWEALGNEGDPSALVLGLPQLERAKATHRSNEANLNLLQLEQQLIQPKVDAAKAAVENQKSLIKKAELDLDRTNLRVPFNGRILQRVATLGQYVNSGSTLATTYSNEVAEIRLPLRTDQLEFIKVPRRSDDDDSFIDLIPIHLYTYFGQTKVEWDARLVRAEGSIDQNTRQLYVIAHIRDPFTTNHPSKRPTKIGMYLNAAIPGKELENVFVVPRRYTFQDREILIFEGGALKRQAIQPLYKSKENIVFQLDSFDQFRISKNLIAFAGDSVKAQELNPLKSATAPEKEATNP
ncbi:MAG: hypothetical protein MK193_12500 [Lentisphaeria bacterium]|nr:hypothetical protein [Lentisphaeria bacterium]